jgi:predicted O-methyltransferase YrrM
MSQTTATNLDQRVEEIKASIKDIQGWLSEDAGITLYELALKYAPNGTIVELGAWKGLSSVWLANGAKDRGNAKLYSIDTWEGSANEAIHAEMLKDYDKDQLYNEFLTNMKNAGVADYVEAIRMTTLQASRIWPVESQIGLLMIDADHSYEGVKKDFEFWSPLVADGGLIVFDDVPTWPGPTKLVTQLPHWYEQVGVSKGQWIVCKKPQG